MWHSVSAYAQDPFAHYQAHGQSEGRRWKGHLCAKEAGEKVCDGAVAVYNAINGDVFEAHADAWTHYQTFGKKEGRIWPGNMC